MVPDKFNMVDMEGIDILFSYGDIIPGLYQKLVESIAQCRYQCLYNWYFDGVLISPTYVEMTVNQDTNDVWINGAVLVTSGDRVLVHLPAIETVSGAIVNITDALPRKVEELICYINPFQSGSGVPSPDNIRPISGFSAINVYDEETYDVSAIPKLTINWRDAAGVIYGGSLTLNEDGSADVVVTKAGKTISQLSGSPYISSGLLRWNSINSLFPGYIYSGNYNAPNAIATMLRGVGDTPIVATDAYRGTFAFGANIFWMSDNTCATAEAYREKYADCLIVWDLKEDNQQSIHLDNVGSLSTYLGTNVIWHDANGDISVTYWKE